MLSTYRCFHRRVEGWGVTWPRGDGRERRGEVSWGRVLLRAAKQDWRSHAPPHPPHFWQRLFLICSLTACGVALDNGHACQCSGTCNTLRKVSEVDDLEANFQELLDEPHRSWDVSGMLSSWGSGDTGVPSSCFSEIKLLRFQPPASRRGPSRTVHRVTNRDVIVRGGSRESRRSAQNPFGK